MALKAAFENNYKDDPLNQKQTPQGLPLALESTSNNNLSDSSTHGNTGIADFGIARPVSPTGTQNDIKLFYPDGSNTFRNASNGDNINTNNKDNTNNNNVNISNDNDIYSDTLDSKMVNSIMNTNAGVVAAQLIELENELKRLQLQQHTQVNSKGARN